MEYPRRKNFSVIYMRTVLSLSLLLFGIGACSFVNVYMHNPCDVSAIAGTLISLAVELAILRWAVRAWFGGWVASGVLVTRRGWFPVNAYSGIIYKREFESHFQDCGRECFIGFDGKVRSVRLVDKRNGNMIYYIGAILDENYTMRVDKAEILDRVIRSFINKRSFESTRQFWGLTRAKYVLRQGGK